METADTSAPDEGTSAIRDLAMASTFLMTSFMQVGPPVQAIFREHTTAIPARAKATLSLHLSLPRAFFSERRAPL